MSEKGAPPRPMVPEPARDRKKRLRRERKARGNGRDGAIRTPGLRHLLFKDLRPSELPANLRQDLKQLYRQIRLRATALGRTIDIDETRLPLVSESSGVSLP